MDMAWQFYLLGTVLSLALYRDKSSVQDFIQCLNWLSIYKALSCVGLVRMYQVLQHAY